MNRMATRLYLHMSLPNQPVILLTTLSRRRMFLTLLLKPRYCQASRGHGRWPRFRWQCESSDSFRASLCPQHPRHPLRHKHSCWGPDLRQGCLHLPPQELRCCCFVFSSRRTGLKRISGTSAYKPCSWQPSFVDPRITSLVLLPLQDALVSHWSAPEQGHVVQPKEPLLLRAALCKTGASATDAVYTFICHILLMLVTRATCMQGKRKVRLTQPPVTGRVTPSPPEG